MRPDPGEGEKRTNEIYHPPPARDGARHRTAHRHHRCPAHPARAGHLSPRARRPLPVHRQGQPAEHARRYPTHPRRTNRPAPTDFESPKPEHRRRSIFQRTQRLPRSDRSSPYGANRRGQVRQAPQRDRYGVTSLTPHDASPQRLLTLNRGHWTIEATHHILDWSFDEDRSRIRTGHGPGNMTRLRRFAIGLIKARGLAVAETMRRLARNPRRVLDFLKMTANACPRAAPA